MGIRVGILVSVAAAAAFFFVEPHLLGLDSPGREITTAVIFCGAVGLAWYFRSKELDQGKKGDFLSQNQVGEGIKASMERTKVSPSSARKAFSGNKVRGKMEIDIKDSEL